MTKRVILPLVANEGTIVYPDDIERFSEVDIETVPGQIIATYTGSLHISPYHPPGSRRPQLIMKGVVSNQAEQTRIALDLREATCPLGTTLVFTATLYSPDGDVFPLSDSFRLPIRQVGGRGGLLLAHMQEGVVTVSAPFTTPGDDGTWLVDEAAINANLPPQLQMSFAGFAVHVFRAGL